MAELENTKKTWTHPEIHTLGFKKTEGGDFDDDAEDADYFPLDPSNEI